jgi:hypothetical protein
MKIIVSIMLGVVIIDLMVLAFTAHVLFALAGLPVLYVIYRLLKQKTPVIPVSGWLLGRAIELSNPDRPDVVAQAAIAPSILNLGLLMIGSPGSGKTVGVLSYIAQLHHHTPGAGWALFEGKGDTDIYRKMVAMGVTPDFFFSSELPGSQTLNLMAGDAQDVVDRLGKILIGETSSTSFYMDEQRAVLARVVPLLCCLPVATNLRDLYVVLAVEDAGNELLRRAAEAGADPVELQLARNWLLQPIGTRLKNIAGLLNRLFIFVSGMQANRLNAYQPDIKIADIVARGQSLYLHLPLTSFARDVAIALVEIFGVEARKRQLGGTEGLVSYPLCFDDWGAFFYNGFGPFSARCRSAAMPLNFGFQSRAQLDAVSPTFADELDDTIATKAIFRVQGDATSSYAVRLLGQYETQEVGTSDGARAGMNLQMTQRARIEPRDLRELQPGEAFVSTLQKTDERIVNPLWRLRVPLPDFKNWETIGMPRARTHDEGHGLSLWSRYMNPARLAEIHLEVQTSMAQDVIAKQQSKDVSREAARAHMDLNPGLAELL